MDKTIVIFTLVVLGSGAAIVYKLFKGNKPTTINLPLLLPLLKTDTERYYNAIKDIVKSKDIVAFPLDVYGTQMPNQLQQDTGCSLATGSPSMQPLIDNIDKIPSNIDYITYNYESSASPDWKRDQESSIDIFSQLKSVVNNSGRKLIITPVYVEHYTVWDWGEIAKYTDILVVQVQNFQTGFNGPDELKPDNLGITLEDAITNVVTQVRAKSPQTKIYPQLGFTYGSTAEDLIIDIGRIKNLGIDGLVIWSNPSSLDSFEEFFNKIKR